MEALIIMMRSNPVALPSSRVIPPIVHYAAGEPFTKYEMCLVFARILGVPHTHIIANATNAFRPFSRAASTKPRERPVA